MPEKPTDRPPPWLTPLPPTTRRAEVEQARRSTPVQSLRGRLKGASGDDEAIKAMAEVLRKLVRRE